MLPTRCLNQPILNNYNFNGTNKVSNKTNYTKKQKLENIGILVGTPVATTSAFLVGFPIISNISYLKKVKKEKELFNQNIQNEVQKTIKKNKSFGDKNPEAEAEDLTEWYNKCYKHKLEYTLYQLKKEKYKYGNIGLKIAVGIGLSAGCAITAIKVQMDKKKSKNKSAPITETVTKNQMNNKITTQQPKETPVFQDFKQKKRQM